RPSDACQPAEGASRWAARSCRRRGCQAARPRGEPIAHECAKLPNRQLSAIPPRPRRRLIDVMQRSCNPGGMTYEGGRSARCAEGRCTRAVGERPDLMGHRLTKCAAIVVELVPVCYDVFRTWAPEGLPVRGGDPSELKSGADPEGGGCSWGIERRLLHRERAVDLGKRTGDERARIGEAGGSELRGGVVVAIEQVVDLANHLEPTVHLVASTEIHDGIAGRGARTEVVGVIRLVQVVLVAGRERARYA